MDAHSSTTYSAPLVDRFAPSTSADRRILVSQIMGLTGIVLFSFSCCALLGTLASLSGMMRYDEDLTVVVFPTAMMLVGTLCYVSTLLALHTIASSLLPLSLRLTLIFAVIYVCLRLGTWATGEPIEAIHVVMLIPFCIGGFIQRRIRRWRSLAWNQTPQSIPMTILGLMDVTAAAALTLMVLTSAIRWADIEPESLLSFAPSSLFMALIGMHCWIRLCALCPMSARAESAYGLWFTINLLIAFIVFIGFLTVYAQSKLAFGAFIVAPLGVVMAHVGTEVPIRWLRGCGWTFERFDKIEHLP
jgi:hypothetical protein